MKTLPLALATGLYIWQAFNLAITSEYALSFVFVSYALANVGLMAAA